MLNFDGKVAIITGAGRGIGRSHALLLAERGTVIVNDFGGDRFGSGGDNAEPAGQVAEEITRRGGTALAACVNITDQAATVSQLPGTVSTGVPTEFQSRPSRIACAASHDPSWLPRMPVRVGG